MKSIFLIFLSLLMITTSLHAQNSTHHNQKEQALYTLIDQYAQAREHRDTVLLKSILTTDVDQLVSSGEWRNGIQEAIAGMMRSSSSNPGTRRLIIEKIRFLSAESAIVDARYEIQNPDGSIRKMNSTFIVLNEQEQWRIAAIRNMLPAKRP